MKEARGAGKVDVKKSAAKSWDPRAERLAREAEAKEARVFNPYP